MLDYTRLAAMEYFDQDKKFIRVYYQDGNYIKESCYDNEEGWYTMPNDIVATGVRDKTPIAATNWHTGRQVGLAAEYPQSSLVVRLT
jgi:hypothetical protein